MNIIHRRLALKFSLAAVAGVATGCGDGSDDPIDQPAGGPAPSPPPGPNPPPTPNPPPLPPSAPTSARLAGSAYAAAGVSNTYTVTLDANATADVTITWSQTGGASLSSSSTVIARGGRSGSIAATWASAGAGSIDFVVSPALTRTGRPLTVAVAAAGAAPIALAFDQATPHQISINAAHTRTLAAGATARVDYRVSGTGSWVDGGYLYRTRTSQGAAADAFAGWVVDLVPGTTYDVRVEVVESGNTTYAQATRATRALPAEGTAQTKSANPGNFSSVMAGAVAGDVIVLAAGTYTLSGFSWTSPGTSGSPVVIRGAGVDSTILVDSTGTVIDLNGSYVTFENMTIRGSQVDGGSNGTSIAVVMDVDGQTNVTFRRIKFDGVDVGVFVWDHYAIGLLVYDCQFIGNNTWDKAYTIPQGQTYPSLTWGDTGVRLPGFGNCVWNCTFRGFGDTFKFGHDGGWGAARACYVYRNWVSMGGDDGVEFDEAAGNCAAYNNVICNSASGASFDGISDGPVGFIRNICVNQSRQPIKVTSSAAGLRIYNNTWIGTSRQTQTGSDSGLGAASGALYDFDWRNNLLIYRGTGPLISFNQSFYGTTVTDYCGWSPDGRSIHFGSGAGTQTGLVAAKAALAPRMAHDVIVASEPFVSPVTLGTNYTTEYTGQPRPVLAAGSAAKNAGALLPGVTDGFNGAAPDIGAVVAGQNFGAVGCSWMSFVPA